MSGGDREYNHVTRGIHPESLDNALDRSAHELQLLANFYHQHGYTDRAQEIYKTILKIRAERDARLGAATEAPDSVGGQTSAS